MKRIFLIAAAFVLIALLAVSAGAEDAHETKYQIGHFEITLSNEWTVANRRSAEYCYVTDDGNKTLILADDDYYNGTPKKNDVSAIEKDLRDGLDKYDCESKEIELCGQKTSLVKVLRDDKCIMYTMVCDDVSACYITFSCDDYDNGEKYLTDCLRSFKIRSEDLSNYCMLGDAQVCVSGMDRWIQQHGVLVVDLVWRNLGDSPSSFLKKVDVEAYQNGIQMEECELLKRSYKGLEDMKTTTKILPGKSIFVRYAFVIQKPFSGITEFTIIADKAFDLEDECDELIYTYYMSR